MPVIAAKRQYRRNKVSGIYQIKHAQSGKVYIGSSCCLNDRWMSHKLLLRKGVHENTHLQRSWNKYGKEAFVFSVIEYSDQSQLLEREQYWIDELQAVKKGFNILPVAGSRVGMKHTPAVCKLLSEMKMGKPSPNRGKSPSDETRAKMADAKRGKTFSPETKRKMSEARKGVHKTFSNAAKERIAQANRQRIYTREAIDKLTAARVLAFSKRREQCQLSI